MSEQRTTPDRPRAAMVRGGERAIAVGFLWALAGASVPGARAEDAAQALREIADTADRICGIASESGSTTELSVKGAVNAELNGLAKRLADLGVSGAGDLTSKSYQGVLQRELADTLNNQRQCKLEVLRTLRGLLPDPPPPPHRAERVPGWVVTVEASEAGGGAHRTFPACTAPVDTPAAIDVRPSLPRGLSPRNVLVAMTARTEQQVADPGRWTYRVTLIGSPTSYTQCTRFEVASDRVPIGGGNVPVLQGEASRFDASMTAEQTEGMHPLTIGLACYFQGGQFPVVAVMLKPPRGAWRRPEAGDLTVPKPEDPDLLTVGTGSPCREPG